MSWSSTVIDILEFSIRGTSPTDEELQNVIDFLKSKIKITNDTKIALAELKEWNLEWLKEEYATPEDLQQVFEERSYDNNRFELLTISPDWEYVFKELFK